MPCSRVIVRGLALLGGVTGLCLALPACGGSESGADLWELRVPLAEPTAGGHSVRAVYQVLPGTPVQDALVRADDDTLGLTLRARIPEGPIIAIAWGFECVEVPLPEPLAGRRTVDDSRRHYPGSDSGIDDTAARKIARQLLRDAEERCQRLDAERVRRTD